MCELNKGSQTRTQYPLKILAFTPANLRKILRPSNEMKPTFALSILLCLLLIVDLSYERKDMGDYWKTKMKGLPMPEAIKELLVLDLPSESDARKNLFVRDFNIKPNVILYHSQHVHNKQKTDVNNNEADQKMSREHEALADQTIKEGMTLPTDRDHVN